MLRNLAKITAVAIMLIGSPTDIAFAAGADISFDVSSILKEGRAWWESVQDHNKIENDKNIRDSAKLLSIAYQKLSASMDISSRLIIKMYNNNEDIPYKEIQESARAVRENTDAVILIASRLDLDWSVKNIELSQSIASNTMTRSIEIRPIVYDILYKISQDRKRIHQVEALNFAHRMQVLSDAAKGLALRIVETIENKKEGGNH